MITIKKALAIIDYKISEGQPFLWNCYGPNAYTLDSTNQETNSEFSVIFDNQNKQLFEMTVSDNNHQRFYRWINPLFLDSHKKESEDRGFDFREVFEGTNYIDLEVLEDFLTKAEAITKGLPYDPRVLIDLEVSDDILFQLMKYAHEKDITLNQLVEQLLRDELDRLKAK